MAERKRLGELLIEARLIDEFQLQTALTHQKQWGGKLGSVLVQLQLVREEDVLRVLAEKLHLIYVDLFEPEIPQEILKLIKPEVVKKFVVMPVRRESETLVVAMSDPMDTEACGAIQFSTGLNVRPALALDTEIRDAIRKYYDGQNIVKNRRPALQAPSHGSSAADADPAAEAPPARFAQGSPVETRHRLEVLINLLVQKGIVTREELEGKRS